MKKRTWLWTAAVVVIFALLVFVGFQWLAPSFSAENLTEKEAKQAALAKYPGEIMKTTKTDHEYKIDMQLETGTYLIRIDAKSGDVISIKRQKGQEKQEGPQETPEKKLTQEEIEKRISSQGRIESIDYVQEKDKAYYKAVVHNKNEVITLKLDPYSGAILDSTKETATIISEKEAIVIAEEHLNGTGDDEAEYHQPPNQTPYYLVEVELEDDREAVVQVDAYTRQVKSVTWEDQDDRDDDAE